MIWEPITMGAALRAAATRAGNQTFVVEADGQERRYSFQEFDGMVDDLARGLLGLGLKRGDLLALWMTNAASSPMNSRKSSTISANTGLSDRNSSERP